MGIPTWTAQQIAGSTEHVVEIDKDVVDRIRGGGKAIALAATQELGSVAGAIERALGPEGPGLALIRGQELAGCTDSELRLLLGALSSALGELTPQNAEGERIVVVSNTHPPDVERARGYLSSSEMRLHTDPTDIAALLCLHTSNHGGGNSFVSVSAVLDALSDEAPDLVHEYFRLWKWDLCGLQQPGADEVVDTPIFSLYRGELSCRYGSRMLREGAKRRTGRLEADDDQLLRLFEAVAHRPELTWRHHLQRGEIVWLNNYRVLHGRNAFVDDATGQVRTLLRVWLWRHRPPALAPAFRPFVDAIDRRPAGG